MAAPVQTACPLFACIIPGRALLTEYIQPDGNRLIYSVPSPTDVTQFAVTLLRPDLPIGHGAGVYFALAQDNGQPLDWAFVGYITNERPSEFFRLPILDASKIVDLTKCTLLIGLNLEKLEDLQTHIPSDCIQENKAVESAMGIAKDLQTFVASFEYDPKSIPRTADALVLPGNIIDRWLQKFSDKHRREPFFWLKPRE